MLFKIRRQKGLVLLTGMIFILIVSTAVVASYQNISSYAFGRAYEIEYIKRFYRLETELVKLENRLVDTSFPSNELEILLGKEHILDGRNETQSLLPDALWLKRADFVQKSGELEYIIEYLGKSKVKNEKEHEEIETSQDIYAWIFRIYVQDKKAREYTMQSMVHVYPMEVLNLLEEKNLAPDSGRIAWFDYTAGE